MGWSIGFDGFWKRDIGYGVPAVCDHPDCNEEIDRGLGCVCGGEPYGGDRGCGLYFCGKHQMGSVWRGKERVGTQLCARCYPRKKEPFKPKPDVREWIEHKLKDKSWAQWRKESPKEVAELRRLLRPVLAMGAAPAIAGGVSCEAAEGTQATGRDQMNEKPGNRFARSK